MTKQTPAPRLTQLGRAPGPSDAAGARELAALLSRTPDAKALPALEGFEQRDTAAVWRLNAREAIVQTIDSLPAIVDDPHAFGAIAAAQAISNVLALGAQPLFALNLMAAPADLPPKVLKAILRGGSDKAAEAGIPLVGGHATVAPRPRYGLAVTGRVHPRRLLTPSGARAGDVLLVTKPIGTGILCTALERGLLDARAARRLIAMLSELNRTAGEVFASRAFRVHALTHLGASGLLGSLLEVSRGSGLRAKLYLERVPLLEGVPGFAAEGVIPEATRGNLEHLERAVRFPRGLPADIQQVLADPQYSGGLLAAVPLREAPKALALLEQAGAGAAAVGELLPGRPGIDVE